MGLKWPNDIVAPGGKAAGILLESLVEGERLAWVVAGIGVNVRRPPRPAAGAAYLDDLAGAVIPLARAAAAVLDGVARAYAVFTESGFEPLRAEYDARAVLPGREVRVSDPRGNALATGVVQGVDASGRLLVRGSDGVAAISSGDVTLREAD